MRHPFWTLSMPLPNIIRIFQSIKKLQCTRIQLGNLFKEGNYKKNRARVVILTCNTPTWPDICPYHILSIYLRQSLLLIQEGQFLVSGERMCTILVNRLEDWACPVNMWLGKLTALDMTPLGWLGRKTSTQTNTSDSMGVMVCTRFPLHGR